MNFDSKEYYERMKSRRSVRDFKSDPVDEEIIKWAISTAGTSPSGANKQPWYFAIIKDPDLKSQIRAAAEAVEREFYLNKASPGFLTDLQPFGTNESKPYLTAAPILIGIFQRLKTEPNNYGTEKTYYSLESTCIATGLLISALHLAGLSTLTHTPKPMGFLNKLLDLDTDYKPVILLAVGKVSDNYAPPPLSKKSLAEISRTY